MIALRNAYICLDCETIFEPSEHVSRFSWTNCPGCGSRALFPLNKWLNPHLDYIHNNDRKRRTLDDIHLPMGLKLRRSHEYHG